MDISYIYISYKITLKTFCIIFSGKGFLEKGKTRLLFNTSFKYGAIALVGIGKEELDDNDLKDGLDPKKENIRIATASNTRTIVCCL